MKTIRALPVLMGAATIVFLATTQIQASPMGEKPKDSPGWVVIEEGWFFLLRYNSSNSLHRARLHFRQKEEKAAANELRQAGSWLRYAAGHGLKNTAESLREAAKGLDALATQLDAGKLENARQLDQGIARASHALAKWHYFKANDYVGKQDEKSAASHLELAAIHLRTAAASANYEYGPNMMTVFESIDDYAETVNAEGVAIKQNVVGKDLTAIEHELNELGIALKKALK